MNLLVGTSSVIDTKLATVPPDSPIRTLYAETEVSISRSEETALSVWLEMKTARSEGMQSSPHAGRIMAPVLVARKSNLV